MDDKNNAETIAELAVKAAGAQVITAADRIFLVTPDGFSWDEVTDPHGLLAKPSAIRQGLVLQDENSLGAYVNRFKGASTILLADIVADTIVGAIDYHHPAAATDLDPQAENVQHRATLTLPRSEEWKSWAAIDGKLVPQLEFARFIEENAADVAAPSGADLIESVRDLQANRKVDFRAAVRTNSENESFEYADNTEAKSASGNLELPTQFVLKIPVYFNGESHELRAFLRWKLDEGKLSLGVRLHRPEHVRQAVFKTIVDRIATETGCDAVFGKLA